MAVSVQKFREIVFQLLYSRAFENSEDEAIVPLLMKEHAISRKSAKEMVQKALLIWERCEMLDTEIKANSHDFSLERIGMIERALLRQGIFELLEGTLPPKVVISEAVRLAKKFATFESASFVNALLDAIYKKREDAQVSDQRESATI